MLAPWWIYLLLVLFAAALLILPWLIRIFSSKTEAARIAESATSEAPISHSQQEVRGAAATSAGR
jgi:hypothetical protein